MASKVRVGLIGTGGIMGRHIGNLLEIPRQASIVALCDIDPARIQRTVERWPALSETPSFADYREMIEKVDLDAVVIATPHTCHYEQIRDSLDAGLHVLVEKPMVCTVEHAKDVVARAKRKRKILNIAYQRHYDPSFRYARKLIADGKLGKVSYITAMQAQNWYGLKDSWRGDPALSGGGQLNDSGSHLLDVMLWVTDLVPAEVFAYINNIEARVDILSALSVKFEGGALGNIAVVGHAPGWREDVSFYGMNGGALFVRDGRLLFQERGGPTADVTDKLKYRNTISRNFIRAIEGKEEPQVPGVCGLRVIQLTQAAWESAKKGRAVAVEK
jgi:predicted dehydrogenase